MSGRCRDETLVDCHSCIVANLSRNYAYKIALRLYQLIMTQTSKADCSLSTHESQRKGLCNAPLSVCFTFSIADRELVNCSCVQSYKWITGAEETHAMMMQCHAARKTTTISSTSATNEYLKAAANSAYDTIASFHKMLPNPQTNRAERATAKAFCASASGEASSCTKQRVNQRDWCRYMLKG